MARPPWDGIGVTLVLVIEGLSQIPDNVRGCVLSVGNFDGVHLGHRELIREAKRPRDGERPAVVLTFDPHPLTVVAPQRAPAPLMPLKERLRWLADAGADVAVVARSEPALLTLEAETFVEEILWQKFHPAHIVEGASFGFGRGRKGNVDLLLRMAGQFGYEMTVVEPVRIRAEDEEILVTSSAIRGFLSAARVEAGNACLGRPYALIGTVVHGAGRGRTIGSPTANLDVGEQLVPGDAVYAGQVEVNGALVDCAVSIGTNPTFAGSQRQAEAFLLDYEGELYGHTLRVELIRRLRGQIAFDSPQALARQIRADVEETRRSLAEWRQKCPLGDSTATTPANRRRPLAI